MPCPCGDKSHDPDKLLEAQARKFINGGEPMRQVWRNWKDPKHRNYKGEAYMAKLTAIIERIKREAA
jgi:hypothetical protein